MSEVEERLRQTIHDLLGARPPTSSICPSDAARALDPERWRDLMEPTRRAAGRLAAEGRVRITQRGAVVDVSTVRGPIRIRLTR